MITTTSSPEPSRPHRQRSRVEDRAHIVLDFLCEHLNERFTYPSLLAVLDLPNSGTTRSAIKRMRDLAEDRGLFSPPAVPANGFTYTVSDQPINALDPALHMGRIESGVGRRRRKLARVLRDGRDRIPAGEQPQADMFMRVENFRADMDEKLQALVDDLNSDLISARRKARAEGAPES